MSDLKTLLASQNLESQQRIAEKTQQLRQALILSQFREALNLSDRAGADYRYFTAHAGEN